MCLFILPGKISSIKNGSNINSGAVVFNSNKYNFENSSGDNSCNAGDGFTVFYLPFQPSFSPDFSVGIEQWDNDLCDKNKNI